MKLYERVGILTVFLVAFGATACDDGSCEDAGRTFAEGSIWTCADGCNGCSCQDGMVTSTLMACGGPPGEAAGKLKCFDGDEWVEHGRTWDCDEGCCRCVDGDVETKPDAC